MRTGPEGIWCEPGGFYIDPSRPSQRAVITHGHADHARPGNKAVLATPETIAIMQARYGAEAGVMLESVPYGQTTRIGDVDVRLVPAGHVLGSAQVVLEYSGSRVVISGDYKRRRDPTCAAFEPVACDVFVTEATFGLPVFRHPDDRDQVALLLRSLAAFPDRCHLIGVYGLGKCQRLIALLREAGYDDTIFLHGALQALCALYRRLGVDLGALAGIDEVGEGRFEGKLVLCPPSATQDRWSRRFADPVRAFASGWMNVRQRAKQRAVELPLIISDHADWDELCSTIEDVRAPRIWVTHGREEALVHHCRTRGLDAAALSLVGYDEEGA